MAKTYEFDHIKIKIKNDIIIDLRILLTIKNQINFKINKKFDLTQLSFDALQYVWQH